MGTQPRNNETLCVYGGTEMTSQDNLRDRMAEVLSRTYTSGPAKVVLEDIAAAQAIIDEFGLTVHHSTQVIGHVGEDYTRIIGKMGEAMNWDVKAEDYANAHHTYERLGYGENMRFHEKFVAGAKWQRAQLRTNEAIERVARVFYENTDHHILTRNSWEDASDDAREDSLDDARAAINALLGDN